MGGAAKLLYNQAKTGFPQETSLKKPVSATETQVLPMRVSSFLPAQVIQASICEGILFVDTLEDPCRPLGVQAEPENEKKVSKRIKRYFF
jgi:hypothetical protein